MDKEKSLPSKVTITVTSPTAIKVLHSLKNGVTKKFAMETAIELLAENEDAKKVLFGSGKLSQNKNKDVHTPKEDEKKQEDNTTEDERPSTDKVKKFSFD